MSDWRRDFLAVPIRFERGRVNDRLRFGSPARIEFVDRARGFAYFSAGKVLGYVRWRANEYGTQHWSLIVAKVMRPAAEEAADRYEKLAHFQGAIRTEKALKLVDEIEENDFDPAEISPNWWIVTGNRMNVRLPARPYFRAQHDAFLKRKAIEIATISAAQSTEIFREKT